MHCDICGIDVCTVASNRKVEQDNPEMNHHKSYILTILIMRGVTIGIEAGGFQYVVLKIANEFGLDSAQKGGMISANHIAYTVVAVLVGLAMDRYDTKKVILSTIAFLLLVVSYALFLQEHTAL